MQAILLAVAGPHSGQRFPVTETETTIGRIPGNGITLDDPSVSRRHCVLRVAGERVLLADLDSHNGTFVNGAPIREREIKPGDRIELGDSAFLFRDGEEAAMPSPTVRLKQGTGPITRFQMQSALGVDTAALLKISTMLVLIENIYVSRGAPAQMPLERQLFELLFDLVAGERGAILLVSEADEIDTLCCWDGKAGCEFTVDKAVVDECLSAGEAVGAPAPDAAALAVPMGLGGRSFGVLYVGSDAPGRVFVDAEVQMLSAVANLLALALDHSREREFLEAENRELRSSSVLDHDMIGESARMRKLYGMVSRVAQGTTTVLIRGESGTGKELVARAIHRNSPRAKMPFVAINCAAVTETLLESEFFGHEKGAFTGAVVQKKGKLETANGGTVFLDEIGELAPALQAKLLRVIQEHEFERVGGTRPIKVDLRIVAATNRDLEHAIREGTFRQDLFYRLNVVTIEMPALRERKEDIPLLAAFFARRFAQRSGRHVRGLSDRTRACLLAYDWPGNVRELENAIERAVVLGSTDLILAEDLPESIAEAQPVALEQGSFHEAVRETKKRLIIAALDQAGWNFTEAARALDLHPNYLHRLATQLQLRRK